jgi:hypothetical protein
MEEKTAVKTFSFLVVTIGIYLLLWQTIRTRAELPVYYYGRLIELLGIGLFVALALHTPMRFSEMGIVTSRQTLLRSLALGGAVALFVFCALAAISKILYGFPSFSWYVRGDISRVTYFLVAPLQEVLAKSVMYYSFELCFGRENPVPIVLMSAAVFGIFHVVYGIRMMLLAMALTVLTGWMFRRVRCVWGCALAHFALGFLPACFGFA